ncbi:BnaCnng16550D [Brassica napus]|uniref:(rape) hypothetical protein n=1 Tax=Brassica napus TaxID=3708 RepID=A0A078IF58_BRANA|nr:unnamed protein product [Brassica napus]CDY48636.1 BnaCnng16550D [Brassica napus]
MQMFKSSDNERRKVDHHYYGPVARPTDTKCGGPKKTISYRTVV